MSSYPTLTKKLRDRTAEVKLDRDTERHPLPPRSGEVTHAIPDHSPYDWATHPQAWIIEHEIISLNLAGHRSHSFARTVNAATATVSQNVHQARANSGPTRLLLP